MMWLGLINTQKQTLNHINQHKPTPINIPDVNGAQKYLATNINQHQSIHVHDVNGVHKYLETNINQHQPP